MCRYYLIVPLCRHTLPNGKYELHAADDRCELLHAELLRINEQAVWAAGSRDTIPFSLPDQCLPRMPSEGDAGNIETYLLQDYCGWECRNTHCAAGLGTEDASYGTPRNGIGWRQGPAA